MFLNPQQSVETTPESILEEKFIEIPSKELKAFRLGRDENFLKQISQFLIQLVTAHRADFEMGYSLSLPSISQMCTLFQCSQGHILNVFLYLREQGYGYNLQRIDQPVLFVKIPAPMPERKGPSVA